LEAQGVTELFGARNVVRKAFETGLIDNGNVWMEMVKSRNLSVHTYNEETKIYIVNAIVDSYFAAFCALHRKLSELAQQEQNEG
jgi:nucleotidyltransferase substrate binding protein (TIGR01987 family)